MQTNVPWVANRAWFFPDERKEISNFIITKAENIAQISPAIETVVNFGVCFLHLNETEKIANPSAEVKPKSNPVNEPRLSFPKAIIIIPTEATIIDSHILN